MRLFQLKIIPKIQLLLAALVFTAPSYAANSDAPSLIHVDKLGTSYPIQGFHISENPAFADKRQAAKSKAPSPHFINEQGESITLTSTNTIQVTGTIDQIKAFAVIPEDFAITFRKPDALNIDQPRQLSVYNLNLERLAKTAWPKEDENSVLFTIIWIQNNQTKTVSSAHHPSTLYGEMQGKLILMKTLGFSVKFDQPDQDSTTNEIIGYPLVLAFVDGKAVPPSPKAIRPANFENIRQLPKNFRQRSELLNAAAACGFNDFLRQFQDTIKKQPVDLRNELLHTAASNGHTESALIILAADNSLSWKPKKPKNSFPTRVLNITPQDVLNLCAIRGHTHALSALLSYASSKGIKNINTEDLLYRAFFNKHFDAGMMLLQRGYGFESLSDKKRSNLAREFVANNRLDLIQLLDPTDSLTAQDFETHISNKIFHRIAAFADIELLEYLYHKGVPIDEENHNAYTPLILAAGYSNIPAVCWFIEKGARIDHRNAHGHTALQYAIIKQQSEAAFCLLDQGSDINLVGPKGVTPLMQAILFHDLETAAAIRGAGGIWNLDSVYLDPCIEFALQQDDYQSLKTALDQGLYPSYSLRKKWPIGWLAAYYDSPNCAALLRSPFPLETTPLTYKNTPLTLLDFDQEKAQELINNEDLPQKIRIRAYVSTQGNATLPIIETPLDRLLENEIRQLAASFKFDRSALDNHTAPLLVDFEIQNASNARLFPTELRLLSISSIQPF